jgi:fatty acid desaturase
MKGKSTMVINQRSKFQKKRARKELPLAFTKTNFMLLAAGILLLLLGNIALAQMPVFGTMPLIVAPILLVVGYCIVIPVAIFYRKKDVPPQQEPSQS